MKMAGMRYTRNRIDNVLRYKHWFFYNRWELAPFPTEFDSYRNKFSSSYFYVQVCCFFSLTLNMNMKNCTWCLRKKNIFQRTLNRALATVISEQCMRLKKNGRILAQNVYQYPNLVGVSLNRHLYHLLKCQNGLLYQW